MMTSLTASDRSSTRRGSASSQLVPVKVSITSFTFCFSFPVGQACLRILFLILWLDKLHFAILHGHSFFTSLRFHLVGFA
jgi:hypothetical protein